MEFQQFTHLCQFYHNSQVFSEAPIIGADVAIPSTIADTARSYAKQTPPPNARKLTRKLMA